MVHRFLNRFKPGYCAMMLPRKIAILVIFLGAWRGLYLAISVLSSRNSCWPGILALHGQFQFEVP